jgi:hypothetical protein
MKCFYQSSQHTQAPFVVSNVGTTVILAGFAKKWSEIKLYSDITGDIYVTTSKRYPFLVPS